MSGLGPHHVTSPVTQAVGLRSASLAGGFLHPLERGVVIVAKTLRDAKHGRLIAPQTPPVLIAPTTPTAVNENTAKDQTRHTIGKTSRENRGYRRAAQKTG